ncbi:hypothetical protein BDV93DRAFT_520298 [Ceratobasidium sp. AG-I]|nr:hypothetical protein BDV93DRAFT_520298 [Ceratobasidium sp. AG-I]
MTSSLASSADVPAWDTPAIITIKHDQRPVPDDWDDDEPAEESAKDIWDRANATAPMPQIQISSQSTVLPPAAAIMPSMRILQRPKSSSPAQSSASTTPGNKTLQEREAEYKAARDRIFASSGGESSSNGGGRGSREGSPAPKRGIMIRARGGGGNGRRGSPGGTSDGNAGSGTVREPMGPQEGSRGFGSRGRRGRGGSPDKHI